MKFKGIAGNNHPSLKKGDPIPLSPEEKVKATAIEYIATNSDIGFKFVPVSAKIIGQVVVTPGREVKNKSEPAQYSATVEVTYRPLSLKDDRLYPTKTRKMKIQCCDCRNDIGIPDVQAVEVSLM